MSALKLDHQNNVSSMTQLFRRIVFEFVIGQLEGRATNQRRWYFRSGRIYKKSAIALAPLVAIAFSAAVPRSSTGKAGSVVPSGAGHGI